MLRAFRLCLGITTLADGTALSTGYSIGNTITDVARIYIPLLLSVVILSAIKNFTRNKKSE